MAKREKKAEHFYIDASGNTIKGIANAAGVGYRDVATKEVTTYLIPGAVPGTVQSMLAAFGAKTLNTNSASTGRQARAADNGAGPSDVAAIVARYAELKDGQWAIPSEGGVRGPRIDNAILAAVLAEMIEERTGKVQDEAKIAAKLESDDKYRRSAWANPHVKVAYAEAAGTGGDVADLALDDDEDDE